MNAALGLILAAAWAGAAGPSSDAAQPHRGVEELRFGPGFSHPQEPDYWSYDFVWRLDDDSVVDEKTLADELTRYFRGLNMTVGGKKYGFDAARFKAGVTAVPLPDGSLAAAFRGRVESYDAFATGKPIVLNVEARRDVCPDGRRRFVAFAISPKAEDAPIWKSLREEAAAFRCR